MTKTRRLIVLAVPMLLLAAAAGAQTCSDPFPTNPVANPSKLIATLQDQNTKDGTVDVVDSYTVSYFAEGSNPLTAIPVQTQSTPKASWSLVQGTTDCYQLTATTTLQSVPISLTTKYVAAMKARGPGGDSGWSPVSNPFVRAPRVPSTPGRPQIQ